MAHTPSHAGSARNAGLLRAYAIAFCSLIALREDQSAFLDGITVELPAPNVNAKETDQDPDPIDVAAFLAKPEPPAGATFKRGKMTLSFAKLRERWVELSGEIAENTKTVRETGRKISRNLGKDADRAMLEACIRNGYRPPEVKEPPKKGA